MSQPTRTVIVRREQVRPVIVREMVARAYWWLQPKPYQQWTMISALDAAAAAVDFEDMRAALPGASIRLATAAEIEAELLEGGEELA